MERVIAPLAGVTNTFLPVLRHVGGRIARGRNGRPLVRPSRAEEIPHRVLGSIRLGSGSLGHYLALTDGLGQGWEGGAVLPPLYPTIWMLTPSLELLSDPGLDLSMFGVIHVRNELRSHRAIDLQDPMTLDLSVESLHRDDKRVLLTVRCDGRVGGRLAQSMHTTLLAGLTPVSVRGEPPVPASPRDDWRTLRRVALGRHHPLRYALLSGDVNPVHLVGPVSRMFGFPRPILHGFCLKGIVAHALVRGVGGGDLSALRRLRLRFRSPVTPPADLEIQIQGSQVRAVSSDGRLLYADGVFRLGPPEDPLKEPGR